MEGFQQQYSPNASKSPRGFSSSSGLKSWSHNLTLFGLLPEAQTRKWVFCFVVWLSQLSLLGTTKVWCFLLFCWLVYFLFILFKTTQAPFSSYCSNCTILDGKNYISWNNLEKFWIWGWNSSQLCCGCCDLIIRMTQLLATLSSLIRQPHLSRHLLSQVHRKLCRYRFSPPLVLTLCGVQSTVKF